MPMNQSSAGDIMNNEKNPDASAIEQATSVIGSESIPRRPECSLAPAVGLMSLALSTSANAAVPGIQDAITPTTLVRPFSELTPSGLVLIEDEITDLPLRSSVTWRDAEGTLHLRAQMLLAEQGDCSGSPGYSPSVPAPQPQPAPSSSYSAPRQSPRTNNAAAAAAAAGTIGALFQLLGDIQSGAKGSQEDYDQAQREIDRITAEELRRYNEQLRQAEEQRRRLEQGGALEGNGSVNPFVSNSPSGSAEDNPFAASSQTPPQGPSPTPDGTNPFAKTATKPKDPTQNYAGQSCAYFTVPSDEAHLNYYADGANACYGDKMYVCEGRRWRYLGPCSAFEGGTKKQAEKQEKTKFNTKIYVDE